MSESVLLRPTWLAPSEIRALTTLRRGGGIGTSTAPFDDFNLGERCGDEADAVARNRAQLREIAHLPSEPRWMRQVHGELALRMSHPHPNPLPPAGEGIGATPKAFPPLPLAGEGWGEGGVESAPEADAAVTSDAGLVLAVLTADCLPVLFCASEGNEIGAAHAGWRGLAAGVLENTVAAMQTPPSELLVWLGPAAGPQAYEIGAEVRDAFLAHDARAASAFVATRPGHWRVDLYALARQRLADTGVTQVFGGDRCTISEPQHFHSHRRDGRSGRMASLIWIESA